MRVDERHWRGTNKALTLDAADDTLDEVLLDRLGDGRISGALDVVEELGVQWMPRS
jgi:hypothetical protein